MRVEGTKVEVVTSEYEFVHGKRPTGFGSWCFTRYADVDLDNVRVVIWVHMSKYGEAKRAAMKQASAQGWEELYVQP